MRQRRPARAAGVIGGFPLLGIILRARLRMVLNSIFRAGRSRRAGALILALVVAGIADLSFTFAGDILAATDPEPAALGGVVAGALTLLCGFTAVTSVTFALSSLFFAKDLDGLLSSPVPPRSVLLSRIVTQICLGIGLGAIIVGPPLLAYTVAIGRPWAVLPVAAAIVALSAIPLVLATGFVIAAVRLVPARYVRGVGGVVMAVAVFSITAVNLFLRGPDAFTARTSGSLDLGRYGGLAGAPWQPLGWTARSVVAFLHGEPLSGALWALPVAVSALILTVLVARLGEGAFVAGYQRTVAAATRRRRDRGSHRLGQSQRRAGPLWLTLATKDAREVRRDAAQLTQLILPLVIFALYIGSPGRNPGELAATALPRWYGTALTAAFASLFSASGIPLHAVGAEGARMWLLRSSPVSARSMLLAKYALGFVIAFGIGGLLLGFGEWRGGLDLVAATGPMLLFAVIVAGLVGLAIGLGAMRPRFDWTDPRRSVGIGTSFAFLGVGGAYLTACFVCLAVPNALAPGSSAAVAVGVAALLAIAFATAAAALYAGGRHLAVIET